MVDTTFVDNATHIEAAWLNYINRFANDAQATGNSKGPSLLPFSQSTTYQTGSVGKLLQRSPSPLDAPYNAVGDGTTDDTAALTAYFAANKNCNLVGPAYTFKCTAAVPIQSGTHLDMRGATLKQVTNNTSLLSIVGKTGIEIFGGNFIGVGTDNIESDSSLAVAIYGSGTESYINVHDCTFLNFSYTTLRAAGGAGFSFCNNKVDMSGVTPMTPGVTGKVYGVLFDAGCSKFKCNGNIFIGGAQSVRVELSGDGTIIGNISDTVVGQHGFYLGSGLYNTVVGFNLVKSPALQGIKLQHTDAAGRDCTGMTFTGNVVVNSGSHGFLIYSSTAYPQTYHIRGLTVTGNVTRATTTDDGFHFGAVIGGTVTGNVSESATSYGCLLDGCSNMVVCDNLFKGSGLSGVRDLAACTNIQIGGNTITDCGQSATVGDRFGIYLQATSYGHTRDNIISDANAKMEYGVYVAANQTTHGVSGNIVLNATGTGARFVASTTMLYYRGNSFSGTGGAVTNDPVPPSVTAAAALTLPAGWDTYIITGNTAITSIIVAGHTGALKTFTFTGTPTVTKGSNLKMPSNFVASADDTWTWMTDGTNVQEIARSANS